MKHALTKTAQDKSQTISKKIEFSLQDQKPVIVGQPAFKESISSAAAWSKGSTLNVTLSGSFLSGGKPALNPAINGIGTPKLDEGDSTDDKIIFSLPLTATISTGTKMNFFITKKASDGSPLASAISEFTVNYKPDTESVKPATNSVGSPPVKKVRNDPK
jgi:hypothetical protein